MPPYWSDNVGELLCLSSGLWSLPEPQRVWSWAERQVQAWGCPVSRAAIAGEKKKLPRKNRNHKHKAMRLRENEPQGLDGGALWGTVR